MTGLSLSFVLNFLWIGYGLSCFYAHKWDLDFNEKLHCVIWSVKSSGRKECGLKSFLHKKNTAKNKTSQNQVAITHIFTRGRETQTATKNSWGHIPVCHYIYDTIKYHTMQAQIVYHYYRPSTDGLQYEHVYNIDITAICGFLQDHLWPKWKEC